MYPGAVRNGKAQKLSLAEDPVCSRLENDILKMKFSQQLKADLRNIFNKTNCDNLVLLLWQ